MSEYLRRPKAGWVEHPRLRHWQARIEEPEVERERTRVEVFRPRDGLGLRPAKMYVTFGTRGGGTLPPDAEEWDDELNRGLVALGVRAVSPENEAQRFALALRAALERAENRFGEGYFNSVLIEELRSSPFAARSEVANVLGAIRENRPSRDGSAYADCRELIHDAIQGRGAELTEDLHYHEGQAATILASALAMYLDERFYVSSRRLLGLSP